MWLATWEKERDNCLGAGIEGRFMIRLWTLSLYPIDVIIFKGFETFNIFNVRAWEGVRLGAKETI